MKCKTIFLLVFNVESLPGFILTKIIIMLDELARAESRTLFICGFVEH